jgi:predicted pyridoxine 5'-phosphate oxidase superfamily flavin-nucleotide-binding protein
VRGYHAGQRAVQRRAGDTSVADRLEPTRAELPGVAQDFLAGLPLLFVAATDPEGQVWASVLSGPPGFVDVPDERTVQIAAAPPPGSPLARALDAGEAPVGLLGLEPETRRRMRVNGHAVRDGGALRVRTEQVYSNCPKYIQRRHVTAAEGEARAPAERSELAPADAERVAAADTFVIATAGPDGADASHRGGDPGFVTLHDAGHLSFPDYAGNTMFMTLGNLAANPRAGLLFLDWETGDALQLTGRAEIDWSEERAAATPGAQRIVDFHVERVLATPGAVPYRWALDERSRFNPPVRVRSPA